MLTNQENLMLENATSFDELKDVALSVLKRMEGPIFQVCGPMTTGGLGSLELNLEVFRKTIDTLKSQGKHVFDQLPFEDHMMRIKESGKSNLLEAFYLPIFESGMIKKLYFIYGWWNSRGSLWEHAEAKRLGIPRRYLPFNFHIEPS